MPGTIQERVKDPQAISRGQKGAATRWGPPRLIRLDEFPPDEREAIARAIEARRAAKRASAEAGLDTSPEAA